MKKRNRSMRSERGAILVEMIFFLPFLIVIWILMNFIYDAKKSAVVTQTRARECGWQYAVNGCGNEMPDQCQGIEAELMEDGEMRGRAAGDFETLRKGAGLTSPNLVNLHGRSFTVLTEQDVTRPPLLGGETRAQGRFATMCGDNSVKDWHQAAVFMSVCGGAIKKKWCSFLP